MQKITNSRIAVTFRKSVSHIFSKSELCFFHLAGIFSNGGAKPNIIPEEAELFYYLRAPTQEALSQVKKKIVGCAQGAAVATGCEVRRPIETLGRTFCVILKWLHNSWTMLNLKETRWVFLEKKYIIATSKCRRSVNHLLHRKCWKVDIKYL